ncbi:glycerophosphodiester phosphodiesterase family protein [Singulisphaera sp. GP187]|uniref:glycerophosphodiester phosphodiesterase family protein n=1 Tax=Singulisphaera sp. GP187 TaxID=1882752 RepID=UPI0013564236|nr:glycerophosphodiester phosphodiesterase family protein [Singulisphaera sp. GP187]
MQLSHANLPTTAFLQNGVTAHRGNSGEFAENTLPAFQSGIDVGADWIELDILRTKDCKLVVLHDRTTGRVGDKNLDVAESTYEELRTVDVATVFRRRTGKTRDECPPQTIPLLDDVLRLVMKQEQTRVSIQPKMDVVAEAIALVRKLGAERWVGFNDGSLPYMTEVKRLAPELPVFWDRAANTDIDDDLRIANQRGFESLVLHSSGVTVEKVEKIKAAGIAVGAWTVDDRAMMETMLDLGVERLYTDHPRRLLALQAGRAFRSLPCEGAYPRHLQGIATNDRDALFWSFTDVLIKTDLDGKVVAKVPVANHHGDLCFHGGKLYVAVNLGQFNKPAGRVDSWVYVYDATTLKELARHKTPEVVHGAGGIAFHGGNFFVVGGLPEGSNENYVYEYDPSFAFQKRHVLASGFTLMGIQTAAFAEGHWWFGCYGKPPVLLKADPSFKLVGRWELDASLGIVGLPDGRLLVARGANEPGKGNMGRVVPAVADDTQGLRIIEPAHPNRK